MTGLLVNFAAASTVVVCVAWLASAILCRASADLRHRIWLVTLLSLPLLWAIPLLRIPVPDAVSIVVTTELGAGSIGAAVARLPWAPWVVSVGWAAGSLLLAAR